MTKQPFLITIDTEGDNLWSNPKDITTENSRYLPRFQELCEAYGLKPTYLVNYEMAECPVFVEFAKDVVRNDTGEIGMHLHAWNSPPVVPLTEDDNAHHPYLIEYSDDMIKRKVAFITHLLEDTFGLDMVSHRAGRWAFNGVYAEELITHGYKVDCSVTPHHSWSRNIGAPMGNGGTDFRFCQEEHYFIDPADPRKPGSSQLLEIPMTVKRCGGAFGRWVDEHLEIRSLPRRVLQKFFPLISWLRPNGNNRDAMLRVLDLVIADRTGHAEFMLHSSEFMPGGSPNFKDEASVERLYDDMACLFEATRDRFFGATLKEFHDLVVRNNDAVVSEARAS